MSSQVTFVPGRKNDQKNPILDGHRYTKDRSRNGNTYYKCTLFKDVCKARITLNDNGDLISAKPTHTHEAQQAEIEVHTAKQNLKCKAATSDLPTKYLVAEAVGGLHFESIAKLNCDLNAMYKMARSSRAISANHPANPTNLETLTLPSYEAALHNAIMTVWSSTCIRGCLINLFIYSGMLY